MSPTMPESLENFRCTLDETGVAVVVFDLVGSRVNKLGSRITREFAHVLDWLEGDATVRAVVLASGKPSGFVAGADLDELAAVREAHEAVELARSAQRVFQRIELLFVHSHKPVIAAIHGAALGGGLELALACSGRVASDDPATVLGLPEVKLGLLPAAGGTQRLPRLVGVETAIDAIVTGKSLRARKALKLGLVDEVVAAPILLEVAKAHARHQASSRPSPEGAVGRLRAFAHDVRTVAGLRELALEDNPLGLKVLFSRAKEAVRAKTHGNYPAPEAALEAMRIGLVDGREAGYAAELERFGRLAVSPESRALVSLFHAAQAKKKDAGGVGADVTPRPTLRLGVLGGGLMGGGIALVTASELGRPVRVRDVSDAGVGRALAYVWRAVERDVERRRLSPFEGARRCSLVTGTTTLEGMASADLIVEAVFEDLELKRRVLREVEAVVGPETVFASNTSSIPIAQIAAEAQHPERVIGMHYFSPVEKMPLLEVVVAEKTAPWVVATCVAFGKAQGKTVIVVRDGTGFYTTRILAPYLNEAAWLLSEGVAIEAIDQAMVSFGFPVGPLVLLDEVGIDVGAKVAHVMHEAFGARLRPAETSARALADGREGRKCGRGFYHYERGKRLGPDESVYALVGRGRGRDATPVAMIQERLAFAMVNEAARCLEEGVLRSATDGDLGAVMGLGFPPFLGGPFRWIDRLGARSVVERLEHLAEQLGQRFEPSALLTEHARSGARFHREGAVP